LKLTLVDNVKVFEVVLVFGESYIETAVSRLSHVPNPFRSSQSQSSYDTPMKSGKPAHSSFNVRFTKNIVPHIGLVGTVFVEG
jgi:hypothetical protein